MCSNMHILAVDDNLVNREVISEILTSWAIENETACNADEAMKHLVRAAKEEHPFDLVLLDYQMPKVDGLELARIIRNNSDISQVSLILLTSSDLTREEYTAPDVRISKCISKPIRQSALLDAILETRGGLPCSTIPNKEEAFSSIKINHKGAHILLAEDNEVNQMIVDEMVCMVGISCDIAANGYQVVDAVKEYKFDLVLMDCQMPGIDGFQATKLIREWEASSENPCSIPIIALTANALKGDREICIAAGMNDYLTKPIMPDVLFAMLDKWLPNTSEQIVAQPVTTSLIEPSAPNAADGSPISIDGLLARCGGKKSLAMKLLSTFCTRTPNELTELEQTLKAGTAAELASQAHRLKGAAATLSAEPLRTEAAELERLAKEDNLSDAAQCMGRIKLEFTRLKDYLTEETKTAA